MGDANIFEIKFNIRAFIAKLDVSQLLAIYVGLVFITCAIYYDFQFFNDSKFYLRMGFQGSNSELHRAILKAIPQYYYVTCLAALAATLHLTRRIHWVLLLPLLHPYFLLLFFNATKESLIFLGMYGVFFLGPSLYTKGLKSQLISVVGLPLMLTKIVYVPFYCVYMLAELRRLKHRDIEIFIICIVALFLALYNLENISFMLERLIKRANFPHVGRSYFEYLCVPEKSNYVSFLSCWLISKFGIVVHEDIVTWKYIIHLSFSVIFWCSVYVATRFDNTIAILSVIGLMTYSVGIFWWGPVAGAAERYFAPITWAVFFAFYRRLVCAGYTKSNQLFWFASGQKLPKHYYTELNSY